MGWNMCISEAFYVRAPDSKDLEMCLCKIHLHTRGSIKALVELCKKQNIPLLVFKSYGTFFECL